MEMVIRNLSWWMSFRSRFRSNQLKFNPRQSGKDTYLVGWYRTQSVENCIYVRFCWCSCHLSCAFNYPESTMYKVGVLSEYRQKFMHKNPTLWWPQLLGSILNNKPKDNNNSMLDSGEKTENYRRILTKIFSTGSPLCWIFFYPDSVWQADWRDTFWRHQQQAWSKRRC